MIKRFIFSFYSRLPSPPYSVCAMDTLRPEDRAPSEAPLVCRNSTPGSLTTSGEGMFIDFYKMHQSVFFNLFHRGNLYSDNLHIAMKKMLREVENCSRSQMGQ
ncbi:hypothetical protein WA026_011648 [Henosepilachna vigintioctopunctata]|uniref:Uncharacterized protein n=1 Tax=Henosepilachna vigintioctopunctata TaxID=420089 RepID=A0AAW1TRT6_9CUCU